MINPSTYEGYSEGLVLLAEGIEFQILAMYATLMKQLASNPDGFLQYSRQADNIVRQYSRGVVEWADTDLADAYIAGLRHTDAEMAEIKPQAKRVQAPRSNQALTATVLTTAEATRKAAQKFKRFAEHVGFYETFKAAAIDKLKDVSVQILRDTRDVYRQIAIETGLDKFRASEVATRRQISQDMLNRFADRGVTGIRYKDGSRRTLTAYTEVVARTMSGHAAMQASMNRYQEYGYDLVRISQHAMPCKLCAPYEGRVFSQSGKSQEYPSIDEAIAGGIFHVHCAHDLSPYFPGLSPGLETRLHPEERSLYAQHGEARAQEITYKATQRQREIERKIRLWKRRDRVAILPEQKQKAQGFIKKWQSEMRDHLNENQYLPRKRWREQIKAAI